MSESNIAQELRKAEAEPWLPIETKLVSWSLGLGLAFLAILAIINHLSPVNI